MNKLILPQETKNFINAVTNPFDCGVPARIPDSDAAQSMSLKDYAVYSGSTVTVTGTTTDCYSIAIGLTIGANRLAEANIIANSLYSMYVILFDASGHKIGPTVLTFANSSTLSTYSNFVRFVGAGIRAKCLIEEVTSSTTIAVSRSFGGLIKTQDVYTSYNAATNFSSLVQQMDCLMAYTNSQGVSVRLDPFQQIYDFKKYRSVSDWENYLSFNCNTYNMPLMYFQFNNPLTRTGAVDSVYTIPLQMEGVVWIEGLVLKPTPLFMSPSPCDLNFDEIAKIIATGCEGSFPIVSEFGSFSNFIKSIGRLSVTAARAIGNSTILPAAANGLLGFPLFSTNNRRNNKKSKRVKRNNNKNASYYPKPKRVVPMGQQRLKRFRSAKNKNGGSRF